MSHQRVFPKDPTQRVCSQEALLEHRIREEAALSNDLICVEPNPHGSVWCKGNKSSGGLFQENGRSPQEEARMIDSRQAVEERLLAEYQQLERSVMKAETPHEDKDSTTPLSR